ncbi:unnamed protein product [Ilex paraguariensis]|uniref:Uncharacterized protein n=1 Tax=Ilex paraguariensis TaxID=185542 RepID=A0ABC8QSX1_9AQUA
MSIEEQFDALGRAVDAGKFSSMSIEEQFDALGRAVDAGKNRYNCLLIRYLGLSNETPYGMMKFLQVAETDSQSPRIVSVQDFFVETTCAGFHFMLGDAREFFMVLISDLHQAGATNVLQAYLGMAKNMMFIHLRIDTLSRRQCHFWSDEVMAASRRSQGLCVPAKSNIHGIKVGIGKNLMRVYMDLVIVSAGKTQR